MNLMNPSTERILDWISRKDVASQFVEEALKTGHVQSISNTVWAFATLQVAAPELLSSIEARYELAS